MHSTTRSIYFSHRLRPPLPSAVVGKEASGAADRDGNRPNDKESTAALPTNGLYVPAKDGGLGATAGDVLGDEVHEQG